MIKNLVSFGCSWTLGSELENKITESYPALVATHNNWTLENLATPNTTLHVMISDLRNWLDNQTEERIAESLIIIGLTDEHRGTTQFSDDETSYNEAVTAFDNIAVDYNAHLLQFNVLTKNYKIKVPTLIDSSSALEMLVIRDKPRKNPLFAEFKHPNALGHKIISEFLIKKLEKTELIE